MTESVLFAATRIGTFKGTQPLTNASGFFFERDRRLYVVTSRHVVIDAPSKHFPDRIELEIHLDEKDLTRTTGFSIPLYADGKSIWHQGRDSGGEVDVAVIALDRAALPKFHVIRAFAPAQLQAADERIELGSALIILGFPLGFHDTLHHLPVARQAAMASAFGIRFQGEGYFLTDARTHRGTSGAPVLMRAPHKPRDGSLPWRLLGVHSAQIDMGNRDQQQDESLSLNCAWYADILMTLTAR
ncbi:S1 family peptidase [Solimonas terrae]|uniref:Trypsin-like peptidase domain-containing protein n=1 Tax=Solimonas terrae TaxID=1396819 RepID=A0A6M2BTQ5_9GAMM|nr:serine protease [Solimonas terrae]NGY05764.1 trypsin-like peptidase domain-containing protein [Solimonas terrae]